MEHVYVESLSSIKISKLIGSNLRNTKTTADKAKKNKYIVIGAGFDIETSTYEYDGKEYAYCYHWQFGLGNVAIMGRTLTSMVKFMKILMEEMGYLRPGAKLMVLDANLGYEWQFCKQYWKSLGITDIFAKEKRDPIYIEVGNQIVFREVLGLFGKSLAQIASNYCGIEKLVGDLDHEKQRNSLTELTDVEIGYCVRDVEILVILCEVIFAKYFGNKPTMPYTSTGIVRAAIKRELGANLKKERQRIKELMPEEWEYQLFRTRLFKGGISGSNILKMNKVLENVVGADITSDYPFQLLTKQFPVGGATRCEPNKFMTEKIPYIAWIRFKRFKAKTSHALMSAHKLMNQKEIKAVMRESRANKSRKEKENGFEIIFDNNRIQYIEYAELIVNDVEFKALKQSYKWDHYEVLSCWEFKEGYAMLPIHIRKVAIEWYLKKENLKAEYSDTQEYRDAKAFVNSIFGMMCTALYLENFDFVEETCDIEGNMDKTYEECCEYLFLSPYWGFWITSYARAMLTDVICKFPSAIIQYDTDSVYFIDGTEEAKALRAYLENFNELTRMRNDIRFAHDEHMLSLGTWDFEKPFKRFKALGAKRYMYEKQNGSIKIVVAGCRESKKYMMKDNEIVGLNLDDIKNKKAFKVSTAQVQNYFNNKTSNEEKDIFDFFSDKMIIDKEYSEKLCSFYVDEYVRFTSTDYQGNIQEIEIPSCIVLRKIPFKMTLSPIHKSLMIAVQREQRNTSNRKVYDIWRKLRKLNTSRMTQIWASTTTGNSLQKNTKS